ncbi:uncharacterized protein LOC134202420 [Armigeres subalbatus]|uniref:uncharacterized protein LOC134202420 n=1 Tax=Armigeres subalbatus TaxID=124917 RepID=UPI002ED4C395
MSQNPDKSLPEMHQDILSNIAHTLDEYRSDCVMCERLNGEESMVQCDGCQLWCHFSCVGVSESIKDRSWSCPKCRRDDILSIASKSHRSRNSKKSGNSDRVYLQLEKLQELQAIQEKFVQEKYRVLESQLELEDENRSVNSRRSQMSKQNSLDKVVNWVNQCAEQKEDNPVPPAGNNSSQPLPPAVPNQAEPKVITASSIIPPVKQQPNSEIPSPLKHPSLLTHRNSCQSGNVPQAGISETGLKRIENTNSHGIFNRIAATIPVAQSTPTHEQVYNQANVVPQLASTDMPPSIFVPPPTLVHTSASLPVVSEPTSVSIMTPVYTQAPIASSVSAASVVLPTYVPPPIAGLQFRLPSTSWSTSAPPPAPVNRMPSVQQLTSIEEEFPTGSIPYDAYPREFHPAAAFVTRSSVGPASRFLPAITSTLAPSRSLHPAPPLREVLLPAPPGKPESPTQAYMPPNNNNANLQHLIKQFGSIALSPSQSTLLNTNLATYAPSPSQLAARQVMPRDLPSFSGNPADWPVFISSFMNTTLACGYSSAENLCRLQRSLKGVAYEAVQSRLLLPESVPHIMETLHLLYGRPELLIAALLEKVRSAPSPKVDKFQTIIDFGMSIQSLCDHLEVAGQVAHLSNPSLLAELVAKLPPHLQLEWGSYLQGFSEVNLKTFSSFMSSVVRTVSKVTVYNSSSGRSSAFVVKSKGNVNAHCSDKKYSVEMISSTKREEVKVCPVCKSAGHRVQDCRSFKTLSIDDRWKRIQSIGLCRNCLSSHGRRSCRKTSICGTDGCEYRHHPLLHSSRRRSDTVVQPLMNIAETHTHRLDEQSLLFRILPVTLHGPNGMVEAFAFLDDGSSLTLIEDSLAVELGINGVQNPLCLLWTANVTRIEKDSQQLSLVISTSERNKQYVLEEVQTVKELSLPIQTLLYKQMSERYTHLKGLPVRSYSEAVPKLLIGINNLNLMVPLKTREGRRHEPVAVKTRLGWCIYGGRISSSQKPTVNCHACGCPSDQTLHDLVKDFFATDGIGAQPVVPLLSEEERRAQQILEDTTVRIGNHFETGLLWKFDHIELPDSFNMALRRLECLERQMNRNPELKLTLQRQLDEYEEKGYAHRASAAELDDADMRRVWYLPLGAVVNPRKPSKFRMIWDARATVNGISLNAVLLKGPDQLTSLPGVLLRFRQFKVGVSADLKEMFHQISIRKEDRHSQRFLWRNDPSETPDVYIMDVATFGSTCSPASAQYIKNKNASDFQDLYPRAVEGIIRNHYVDDSLESYESIGEAIRVSQEMRLVHKKGGFELRNWLSNSREVLRSLGQAKPEQGKMFAADKQNDYERVLGILWSTTDDAFSFSTEMKKDIIDLINSNERPTKRQLLKCLMTLFDPLGLLSHFIVHGKILLQDVWRSGIQWDEKVNDDLHRRWQNWKNLFEDVRKLKIPRCYFDGATNKRYKNLQLHTFVDASEAAYCAAAYFRTINPDGVPVCVLVAAKTKVAPLKTQSIPRLELQAAVLGGRLSQFVEENHTVRITRKNRRIVNDKRCEKLALGAFKT